VNQGTETLHPEVEMQPPAAVAAVAEAAREMLESVIVSGSLANRETGIVSVNESVLNARGLKEIASEIEAGETPKIPRVRSVPSPHRLAKKMRAEPKGDDKREHPFSLSSSIFSLFD